MLFGSLSVAVIGYVPAVADDVTVVAYDAVIPSPLTTPVIVPVSVGIALFRPIVKLFGVTVRDAVLMVTLLVLLVALALKVLVTPA